MAMIDLGEVERSGPTLKRVTLGAGKECVITPTLLADGNLEMDLAIDTKASDGKAQRLGQGRLTATSRTAVCRLGWPDDR
jgi:hypothetical protein